MAKNTGFKKPSWCGKNFIVFVLCVPYGSSKKNTRGEEEEFRQNACFPPKKINMQSFFPSMINEENATHKTPNRFLKNHTSCVNCTYLVHMEKYGDNSSE